MYTFTQPQTLNQPMCIYCSIVRANEEAGLTLQYWQQFQRPDDITEGHFRIYGTHMAFERGMYRCVHSGENESDVLLYYSLSRVCFFYTDICFIDSCAC